ncbi:hypothetical protein CORC01_02570, partial [Colletotrichum orchidophilum]
RHDSVKIHRNVAEKDSWPKSQYATALRSVDRDLNDQQRFRLGPRYKISHATPNCKIQLSYQTVNSFLQTPGRSRDFHIDAAHAARIVINQANRYLVVRLSSSEKIFYRSSSEDEKDPILALGVALSALLAIRQYCEERPLAKFALDNILKSYPNNKTIFRTPITDDMNALTPKDWIAPHWVADMCFTPCSGTSIEPLIYICCVYGQKEALKSFTSQKYNHSDDYKEKGRSMSNGRKCQIICGAIGAFIKVRVYHGIACRKENIKNEKLDGTAEFPEGRCQRVLRDSLAAVRSARHSRKCKGG